MVEWKKLGEVCEVLDSQRKPVSKGNRSQGEYPYYGANGIQDYVDGYIFDGTYLLLGEDGSVINTDNSPVLHWATGKIWVNNHAHILQENNKALLRYLYYTLQCTDVSDIVRGMPPKINQANMRNILIPIPSLSEQTRIVGILDTFTASIENLKEQIAQRRKQYEYYRDELLDFSNDNRMVWKLLGSVFPFIRNGFVGTVTPYFTNMENGVRYLEGTNIHNGTISDNTLLYVTHDFHQKHQKSKLKADDILMVQSGHIGECAIVGEKYQGANCHALIIMSNGGFCNSKFIVHYFHTYKGLKSLSPAITGGAIKHVLAKKVGKILVPVPSLEEQSRIVSILDTFEASIQNLEAQLKQREKQYEYYRNKLLTFE